MENDLRCVVDALPGLVWTARPDGSVDFVNRRWAAYTGQRAGEAGARWQTAIHPDDRAAFLDRWHAALASGSCQEMDARLRRVDGEYRRFAFRSSPMADSSGTVVKWCGLAVDVEDQRRADDARSDRVDDGTGGEALLAGEKHLLQMVTRGHSMSGILDALCRLVEGTAGECFCSVVLVDPSGQRLAHGAAPSLPASFIDAIVGRPVGVDSGPCAMAVYLNEQVIAVDLTSETRWAEYAWCSLALAHGLQSCWSTPVSATDGRVLGAIALYYDTPRMPTPHHQALIEQFTDIASIAIESAQSDAALKSSEARKAAILDSALDCIVTIDHEGYITEFNPAAERTFGYRRKDVMGRLLADVIIPPSAREAHQHGLARYLRTGEPRVLGRHVEMRAMRADGSEFPVELAITRIPLEGSPSFTGYLRDITERKQYEEELRRGQAFLVEAQRLSLTGSLSWRVATEDITWSEQTYRIFGIDPGTRVTLAMIGSRVHPEDMPLFADMLQRAQNAGSDFEYEHRLLMPDGSIKYLHLVAHATRDKDDRLEYIGAVQDVTQRRLSEDALGKARSELAHVARVTTLGVMTASIAHEVNQPLSGIITNASTCLRMLAADPPNVDGARDTARRTIRDGHRAAEVITHLRALFRKKEAATEPVDLNEATREVLALSMHRLQRSRVILQPELAESLPTVAGDRVQLQQVILNLVGNAADAMSEVDDRPRQLVIRTGRDEEDRVRLTVQDAGVGIDPRGVERLFEAFYSTKRDGMGIGLSVSRSIIESHHGCLWAAPNEGPGATFAFSLPRAQPAHAESAMRAP
jgi:PAS domain S-box-containing protein